MQRTEEEDTPRSRPTSRRNSASLSRRSSNKKEKEGKKKSPLNTAPSSATSTPKKQVKEKPEFCVTGRQILKKSDRASSLPGYPRRPPVDSARRRVDTTPAAATPRPSKSRDTSLEDDMSLDLSQVSDFEDTNLKSPTTAGVGAGAGAARRPAPVATSTPQPGTTARSPQARSASMQSQLHSQKLESSIKTHRMDSGRQSYSTFCSRDSLYKTSSNTSNYRYGTELDYSSVSPEYSGQSSADLSPRNLTTTVSPRSQELHVSSCCISTWQDCSEAETKVEEYQRDGGEWGTFWANYNNSLGKVPVPVPVQRYYDQCPTPYRSQHILSQEFDFSTASSKKHSPEEFKKINDVIRNEGIHLTPRETQSMIKCAHILGNVLSKAIERRAKEKDVDFEDSTDDKLQEISLKPEITKENEESENQKQGIMSNEPLLDPEVKEIKKKTLTLNLKETALPLEIKEEIKQENVMTQTDISLPNTKSAPKIFEKILRQLSKTSLEESIEKMEKKDVKEGIIMEKKEEDNKDEK